MLAVPAVPNLLSSIQCPQPSGRRPRMTYGLSASASVSRFWPKGHVLPAYAVEVLETDASVAP